MPTRRRMSLRLKSDGSLWNDDGRPRAREAGASDLRMFTEAYRGSWRRMHHYACKNC